MTWVLFVDLIVSSSFTAAIPMKKTRAGRKMTACEVAGEPGQGDNVRANGSLASISDIATKPAH